MPDRVSQQEINDVLWRACDTFRGALDAERYKDYLLPMLFLKYVSDAWQEHRTAYEARYVGDRMRVDRALKRERFVVPADSEFSFLYARRNEPNIGELINIAFSNLEDANRAKLENVFRNVDYNSEAQLGDARERNRRLKSLLEDFAKDTLDLRPSVIGDRDIIGDAYEFLIGKFASGAGKKGGEFYTPREVARLLARLLEPKAGDRIADPTCGSGSLLIRVAREVGSDDFALYGQEVNGATWALCKMNMFLHGVDGARIEWGNTLTNPKLTERGDARGDGRDRLLKFEVVVANPPFSLDKWGAEDAAADPFRRFHRGTPPKSKADWAFISHMVETAKENGGRVGVIVPHGVLFRGGAEGKIRQRMVEEGIIEAVIGLPVNLFFGTGIPAAILLFRKGRIDNDILFVDASRDYEAGKKQNRLREDDLARIVAAVRTHEDIQRYARVATIAELRENDFNLNISRYVDTYEREQDIDVATVQQDIAEIEKELMICRKNIAQRLSELGLGTP
jgi:type I restriction enzyme M protein